MSSAAERESEEVREDVREREEVRKEQWEEVQQRKEVQLREEVQQREEAQQVEQSTSRNIKMNIGGGNPKLSSNLKHSKASLKKLYKSRLTYKKSWEEKYFLYVLISTGETHRGGKLCSGGGGGGGGGIPGFLSLCIKPCSLNFAVYIYIYTSKSQLRLVRLCFACTI